MVMHIRNETLKREVRLKRQIYHEIIIKQQHAMR
jgi:hypothetical protein